MLSYNLWSKAGLTNGAIGYVQDIIYKPESCARDLPIAVIVKFDNYKGPKFQGLEKNNVPIIPVCFEHDYGIYRRTQIPLMLSWH